MIVDQIIDLQNEFIKVHFEANEEKKKELGTKLLTETLPTNLKYLEAILNSNKTNSGFLVGDSLTLADLAAIGLWGWVKDKIEPLFANFPIIKQHSDKIHNLPGIANWIATRPVTDL